MNPLSLDIGNLRNLYARDEITPDEVIAKVFARIDDTRAANAWIHVLSRERIEGYLAGLAALPTDLPLWGIPFAIKDNIDLAGEPTTAACPDYAYVPQRSAPVVEALIAAGAIPIGKTNLDQFATGLVGVRSPYGPGRNVFNPDYISGGSSAGSAIAVANGSVSFALGTDTAGSGRVPAAFNNIVGLKPTKGLLSTRGVVAACRSLDCVSIFALNADDARAVLDVADRFDAADPFARAERPSAAMPEAFRFGVPRAEQLEFFGNGEAQRRFHLVVQRLADLGGTPVTVEFGPFLAAARLLYEGPWVAERYAAIEAFIERKPEALFPVTRAIIEKGKEPSAVEAFKAAYRLAALKREADSTWRQVDVMLTPTAGTHYSLAEVAADPVRLNTNLGYYTNFMNLLDYSAVAVPAALQSDGLPFGVTLFAPAGHDRALLSLAERLHQAVHLPMGATGHPLPAARLHGRGDPSWIEVAVCGAHMEGLPLNHQLIERGARLVRRTRTAPCYRFYALPGGPPARPGMVRVGSGGGAIECEVWGLPVERFGSLVAGIPAPLGIGWVELADGSRVQGFLCEGYAAEAGEEITTVGSWRRYVARAG